MLDGAEYRGKRVHRVAGQPTEERRGRGGGIWKGSPKGRGRGIESHGLGGGLQEHLRFCVFVGNTALLAANLLFEMLCALPKVTVV